MLLIVVALHIPVVGAAADDRLYTGEVIVSSQSEADREQVIPQALIQVLQKLSGQREMPVSPALDDALANANKLLLSFRYKNVDRTAPDGTVNQELRLVVRFLQAGVDRIVQQAGLPRWRQERPPVQVWVVVDDGFSRELKPVEFNYAWESMEDVAAIRGLPLGWPELDEEEEQLIDMRLVWGGFTDYLVERGAPADGVAIVAARREGPRWTLRWNVAVGERNWSWRNSDQELLFALADGIHQMTDQIAASNSIAASEQGTWTTDLTVGGLNSSFDYASCLEYLQNLSLVNAVQVLGADPGRVHFRVQLNAPLDHLSETLNRGAVLIPSSVGEDYDYEFSAY